MINIWVSSSDCIGSAFNVKGAMQCPNCRKIEKGQWLYANGYRSFPEFSMDDWTHDEDLYDLGSSEMVRKHTIYENLYGLGYSEIVTKQNLCENLISCCLKW